MVCFQSKVHRAHIYIWEKKDSKISSSLLGGQCIAAT